MAEAHYFETKEAARNYANWARRKGFGASGPHYVKGHKRHWMVEVWRM
jgi:hypothetical protein